MHLRNTKGFKWNHKRLYRIYKQLELNLRIKPRKRIKRDKSQALSVPLSINQTWSIDFMSDSLNTGRKIRAFNVIDDGLALLSGSSFLNRQYNLQYLLEMGKAYEIALVNTSSKNKKVEFKVVDFNDSVLMEKCITLKPKQVFILPIKDVPNPGQLVIKSKIIMARPVVFCFDNDKMDVFHG